MLLAIGTVGESKPGATRIEELHRWIEEDLAAEELVPLAESAGVLADADHPDPEDRLKVRTLLHAAVEEVLSPLAHGRMPPRDVIYPRLGGVLYAMSGGPSWGDPPTKGFDQIELLVRAGLLGEAE